MTYFKWILRFFHKDYENTKFYVIYLGNIKIVLNKANSTNKKNTVFYNWLQILSGIKF